jgi:Protein tyrosine and serine/threonine kinase
MGPVFGPLCAPYGLAYPRARGCPPALRATGNEDTQVLSLLAVHCALPPDPTLDRSGERFGGCTLEERLGAGGMGVVYRAQQHLGLATRPVAVKLIHPALLLMAREEALARFLAELQILVTLQHEHIARIYDGGIYEDPHTHEQLPYIVMELVQGGYQLPPIPGTTPCPGRNVWPCLYACVTRSGMRMSTGSSTAT